MEDQQIYFRFLDSLRKTGACNMFGASPYLEVAYGLDEKAAISVLSEWMTTFDERHPA